MLASWSTWWTLKITTFEWWVPKLLHWTESYLFNACVWPHIICLAHFKNNQLLRNILKSSLHSVKWYRKVVGGLWNKRLLLGFAGMLDRRSDGVLASLEDWLYLIVRCCCSTRHTGHYLHIVIHGYMCWIVVVSQPNVNELSCSSKITLHFVPISSQ